LNATFNIKVAPRRMLSKQEAALYCGLSASKFEALFPKGPTIMPTGQKVYDIKALDTWLDSLDKSSPDSDDAILGRLRG
jgi:hypothetical protein